MAAKFHINHLPPRSRAEIDARRGAMAGLATGSGNNARFRELVAEGERLTARMAINRSRAKPLARNPAEALKAIAAKRRAVFSREAAVHEAAHACYAVLAGIPGFGGSSIGEDNCGETVVAGLRGERSEMARVCHCVGYAAEAFAAGRHSFDVLSTDRNDLDAALSGLPFADRSAAELNAKAKAADFVSRRWLAIQALAAALVERGRVGREDCQRIIRSNI